MAKDNVVLAYYGELPDELAGALEHHLMTCDECRLELEALQAMEPPLAAIPMADPSPNFLAQSRMRLDDALDIMPPHGVLTRLRTNFFAWVGHLRSAPALATLLVGVGFIGGNFIERYQQAQLHNTPKQAPYSAINQAQSVIGNITGIERTPDSEMVQVHYNRVVPETFVGSLDTPEARELLLKGAMAPTDDVRSESVSMLASECKNGHQCQARDDGKGVRNALLVTLRYDKDAGVRLKALEGLQPYIAQDQKVRDAVLDSLASDPDAKVRMATVSLLEPVQNDSSVRQVLRHASTADENPYIRTVSYNALQGSGSIQ
jgi:hypothetical protein